MSRNAGSFTSESAISPMQELMEPEFRLDMDLENMDGIVDTTIASQAAPAGPGQTSTRLASGSTLGSLNLEEPIQGGSLSTSASGMSSQATASTSTGASKGSVSLNDPFARSNSLHTDSPRSSVSNQTRTPPSPSNGIPTKHHTPSIVLPNRPSQLRNVKISSFDSQASSGSSATPDNIPTWASTRTPDASLFSDPFGAGQVTRPLLEKSVSPSRAEFPYLPGRLSLVDETGIGSPTGSGAGSAPPVVGPAGGAAWAAPESWGVEADGTPEDTSSGDEDEWVAGDDTEGPSSPPDEPTELSSSPSAPARKPPPFGYKSSTTRPSSEGGRPGSQASRPRTGTGRPGTATRPLTAGRPGTAGSLHALNIPVSPLAVEKGNR